MTNILIVGMPGVGKTWVVRQLLSLCNKKGRIGSKMKFHYSNKIIIPGNYTFKKHQIGYIHAGADQLSRSCILDLPKLKFWAKNIPIVLDGRRFANKYTIDILEPYIIKIKGSGLVGRIERNKIREQYKYESRDTKTHKELRRHERLLSDISEDILVENSTLALEIVKNKLKLKI